MLESVAGFDWDEGNIAKCQKHGVSVEEIEALFQNEDFVFAPDIAHSKSEQRFRAVGSNRIGRMIFLVFTFRRREASVLVRVISARYMHKKEIEEYEEEIS
jgi:uncharacterized protein